MGQTLLRIFVGIFVIQMMFYVIAAAHRTDKLTDLAYGSTFALVSVVLYFWLSAELLFQAIIVLCVTLWGVRLSGYLFIRVLRMGRDRRFDGMREQWRSFLKFWLLQTVTIWIVLLPVIWLLLTSTQEAFGAIFRVGFAVWLVGFLLETIADWQKFQYKQAHPDHRVDVGLWKKSRHPNYLGEMLVWRGVWLMCSMAIGDAMWWTMISPLSIMILLRFVSGVSLLEKQHDARYGENPDYLAYKEQSNMFVPI